jgi:hypothetical protein
MTYYIKKPIEVEARQLTEANAEELAEWSDSNITRRPDGTVSGMIVYTLEGLMAGQIGDYLIKGVRGEFYFCAKDIFEETYEESIDDYHIAITKFEEQADGSALVSFDMGRESLLAFARIGIIKTLEDEANRVIDINSVDIDTNVGC